MKRIRLFCLVVIIGAGALFLIPKFAAAETNQVTVSAYVPESISVIYNQNHYQIATNYAGGYWKLNEKDQVIVVARY